MRSYFLLIAACLLAACTTGEKMSELREGMTRDQVVAALGQPDGFQREGDTEALTYANRLMSGWSWDRADYQVILSGNHVTAYGPGTVRQNRGPNVGTLVIVPAR